MMRRSALLAAAALGFALPANAQDRGDPVRLDDFAVTQGQGGTGMDQLTGDTAPLAPANPAASDHELAIPGPPEVERAPVAQLSERGETAPAQQLSDTRQSRQLASGSVSAPGDSRPQASAPLAGADRCDPELEGEQRAQCLQILERRAAEFDAPEAPRLSAEQVLLAERGEDGQRMARSSSDLRVRLAADDPDADLASNQELASIFNDRSRAQEQAAIAAEPDVPDDATLAQVLEGMQVDTSGVLGN